MEQDGEARLLFVSFPIKVVVESAEFPPHLITVRVLKGNLKQLDGRYRIEAGGAPVVAVSPLVGGRSLKGPTEAFLRGLGRPVSAAGVASLYGGLLDGMVVDPDEPEPPEGLELLTAPTVMGDAAQRRELGERVLAFARGLA